MLAPAGAQLLATAELQAAPSSPPSLTDPRAELHSKGWRVPMAASGPLVGSASCFEKAEVPKLPKLMRLKPGGPHLGEVASDVLLDADVNE